MTATIFRAVGVQACLPPLRRINSVEPNPRAANLDRITVDDRCPPNDVSGMRRPGYGNAGEEDCYSHHVNRECTCA